MSERLIMSLAAAAALFAASGARAENPHPHGGLLAQTDIEFGGDSVATVAFDDGDTQNVHAGQGLSLGLGGYFRPNPEGPFEIDAVLGFKYVTTAASNADINISRMVFKLNGMWRFDPGWFVGAGLTHHMSPELDGDGFFEDVPFDDATGFSAEVGWRWIALRYTKIEYSNEFIEDVDASSIGLSFTWRFGGSRGGY